MTKEHILDKYLIKKEAGRYYLTPKWFVNWWMFWKRITKDEADNLRWSYPPIQRALKFHREELKKKGRMKTEEKTISEVLSHEQLQEISDNSCIAGNSTVKECIEIIKECHEDNQEFYRDNQERYLENQREKEEIIEQKKFILKKRFILEKYLKFLEELIKK